MTFRKPSFTSRNPPDPDRPILYFDFVDPASHLVSRLIDRAGVTEAVQWRGFELRPPPEPTIDPGAAEWSAREAMAEGHARQSAAEGHALETVSDPPPRTLESGRDAGAPSIIPWTRKAHELCEFARERDCLHAVRRALFRAHFVDHIDIGRIDLLVKVAQAEGLDSTEARAVLDVDRHAAAVLGNRGSALEAGIRDVPAVARPGGWLAGPAALGEIERAIEMMVAATRRTPGTGQAHGSRGSNR